MNGLERKRRAIVLAFLAVLVVTLSTGAPPQLIRYQGRLADDAGVGLQGTHDVDFAIYGVDSGGTAIWSEDRPPMNVNDGVVDVLLGELTPLTSGVFIAADRWLEVTVDGVVLAPRQRLSSVPFSHASERLGDQLLGEVLDRASHTGTQLPSTINPQGVGSGLDADTVEGREASFFVDTSVTPQTKQGPLTIRGPLIAGALEAGWVNNLGLTLPGGTLAITDASGLPLSSQNVGYVTVPSATPGQLATLMVAAPFSFSASDVTSLGFGITESANWAEDMPFFLYVVNRNNSDLDGSDGNSAFFLARSFSMHTTPNTFGDIGDTDAIPTNDNQDVILLLGSYTTSNYASLPSQLVGAIRMQWSPPTWTVQDLGNADGMGRAQLTKTFGTTWTFPRGQNGALANSYLKLNGGTAVPVFSQQIIEYTIHPTGEFRVYVNLSGDGGADGSGAVNTTLTVPYHIRNLRVLELGWWLRIATVDRPGGFDFTTNTNFVNINAFTVTGGQVNAVIDSPPLSEWSNGERRIFGSAVLKAYLGNTAS